jgi:hypothetical protein
MSVLKGRIDYGVRLIESLAAKLHACTARERDATGIKCLELAASGFSFPP